MTMNEITPANGALMSFIERAAKDPEFDVQKFGELLRLQRDVGHDQSRRAFNQAMAEAQAEMLPVVRSAQNKHLGNKYAKLEDIDREMRPIYTRHGFSVRYGSAPSPSEGTIRLTCTVAHAAGYFEENYLDAPLGNPGSQGGRTATTPVQSVGSAVTYLRRYLLGMVFNIVLADDDDDGEGTRRAAAAPMPRAARIAEKVPAYDTAWLAPLDEPNGHIWLGNLERVLAACTSQDEVTEAGGHVSVRNAVAKAPPDIRRRVSELLAQHFARLAPDPAQPSDEVAIVGEDKIAAG
jgi:hypothetical protein